jgi:hypothetical protein
MKISDFWTVQYSPTQDAFSVDQLSSYFTDTHRIFYEGVVGDRILLSMHPTHEGARDECAIWQSRRNKSPISRDDRAARILRDLAFYFGESIQMKAGLELSDPLPRPDRTSTE